MLSHTTADPACPSPSPHTVSAVTASSGKPCGCALPKAYAAVYIQLAGVFYTKVLPPYMVFLIAYSEAMTATAIRNRIRTNVHGQNE
jgi:hypothetical protein